MYYYIETTERRMADPLPTHFPGDFKAFLLVAVVLTGMLVIITTL
jgi:hypothetical protein